MHYNELTAEEENIIEHKDTEPPFSGKYDNFYGEGIFICKKCNTPLFTSESKFDAGCGWPAFDSQYKDNVKRIPDPDDFRTEIVCANCGAHLGHVFEGEGFTKKNTRHCVNSLSIKFVHKDEHLPKVIS